MTHSSNRPSWGLAIVGLVFAAILLVIFLNRGGGGPANRPDDCDQAAASLVSAIEDGLTVGGGGSLSNAFIVRSDDFERVYFVGAQIEGEGLDQAVGVWATNERDGGGSIHSANAIAEEFSDWGGGPGFSSSDDGFAEAYDCAES